MPDPMLRMRALNHLSLVVSDVARSAEFYRAVFGMEEQSRAEDFAFLGCGESDLALVKGQPLIHRRFHFGFRVETRAEVDAWLERVHGHRAAVTHGPEDYGDYYTFSLRDPDGYAVEIYYEAEPRGRAGDVTAPD